MLVQQQYKKIGEINHQFISSIFFIISLKSVGTK